MIAFITIIYVVAIVLVFRVLRVRPRPWPVALFVVVGILIIGGIVVFWTLAAPISERAVVTRYVVQVVPWVKGTVLSIPAKPNVPMKKGSVLFQIDPAPFQDAVNQAMGQWKVAKSNVEELQAAANVAKATEEKAKANLQAALFAYEADTKLAKDNIGAISELKVARDKANYEARRQLCNKQCPASCRRSRLCNRARTLWPVPKRNWIRLSSIYRNAPCWPRRTVL